MATCRTRTCVFDFQGRCSTSELTCLEGVTPCVSRHTPRQSRAHRIDAHDSKSIPQRNVVLQSQIGACLQAPIPFGGGNRPIHCQTLTFAHPLPYVRHFGARCPFPAAPRRQVQNVSQSKLILEQQNSLPWRWRAAALTAAADPALYRVESGAHAPRQQIHRLRSGQSVDGHQGVDDAPDLRPPSFNAPTKSDIHAPLYCSTLQLSRQTSSLVDEHLQKRLLASGDSPPRRQQQEETRQVRLEWQRQQRHPCLLRRPVILTCVARSATRRQVRVHVAATARGGRYVITGQVPHRKLATTVQAHIPVAGEQNPVAHHLLAAAAASAALADGNDRVDVHAGPRSIAASTAAQPDRGIARLPAYPAACVKVGGVLPSQPLDGHASDIQFQYMREHRAILESSIICLPIKHPLSSNLDCRRASNRRFAARPPPIARILRHQSCGDTLAAHLEAATDAGHACPTYRGGLRSGR